MDAPPFAGDLLEFLRLMTSAEAEFLLIGGYAVGAHGFPRNTGDMDLWVNPTAANAARVESVLRDFGFTVDDATRQSLTTPGKVIRMGYPPARIELLTAPTGVEFDLCRARSDVIDSGGCSIPVISLQDLLANKRAAGRPRDLIDVAELERIQGRQSR